jgi:hypothetical protein
MVLLDASHSGCVVGSRCQFYDRSIGLTLDDILREEIRTNMTLNNQPFTVKMSAALTMIMFVAGLINGVFSFLTFRNEDLQKIGCGVYLLASSITSLLTIFMFVVKFWFVILTQMNITVHLSVLRGGCVSIEPILKLFVYLDAWLNACVAVERSVNVSKGVNFDKEKSKRIARWIIILLPFCVMGSIIHEPLYRELVGDRTDGSNIMKNMREKYNTTGNMIEEDNAMKNMTVENTSENYVWCMTRYSRSVQDYNTAILFFHLVAPFVANLFSALFIVFGTARRRTTARTRQKYRKHVHKQLSEHKQLVISPVILLVLSSPRLIIALTGCVNVSRSPWLYLFLYFISFTPSMLVFSIFVLPSQLYRKTFKDSIRSWRGRMHF